MVDFPKPASARIKRDGFFSPPGRSDRTVTKHDLSLHGGRPRPRGVILPFWAARRGSPVATVGEGQRPAAVPSESYKTSPNIHRPSRLRSASSSAPRHFQTLPPAPAAERRCTSVSFTRRQASGSARNNRHQLRL